MNHLSILIAEDDSDDRFLMQRALEEADAKEKISFVDNGVQLLNHLHALKEEQAFDDYPQFIILDLNMPKMDGREVLRTLKSHPDFRKIPVIIFSTTKNQLEVKRCYDMGANTYIVKPVDFDSLVEIIRQIRLYWLNTATLADAV